MKNELERAEELAALLSSTSPPLDRALLLLSEFLQQRPGIVAAGLEALDDLANDIRGTDWDSSSPAGLAKIHLLVEGIFGTAGFVGDVDDYHSEQNSFLDRVLERRVGMPITLSSVVEAVGARLGVPLALIGLPGHVVVGVPSERDTFIDAFSGTVVDRLGLEARLRSIFGHNMAINDASLRPMGTSSVVVRVCNNLMRTWADDHQKFDRLLDVRSLLPLENSDQRMLIEIAEARARFDIAARLRASIDPDDPEIDALWGRLN